MYDARRPIAEPRSYCAFVFFGFAATRARDSAMARLTASSNPRAISAGGQILVDRDNDKNPVVALREIADDVVDNDELRETLIGTLQRVDEHSEAEEEAETLALLADPTHMQMSEQELVRALQSDRDGGQEERY